MVFHSLSLPVNIIEKLKLLKTCYEEVYRKKMSYGEIFERLLSSVGLGSVDPPVYDMFQDALKTRAEFNEVVTRSTKKIVDEIEARAAANGTTFLEEAEKEQKEVIEEAKAFDEAYDNMTDEEKCRRILNEWAENWKPKSSFWTGYWMVHHDGLLFALLKGKNGLSDYAEIDVAGQEALKTKKRNMSEKELLDMGFIKMEHPKQ